MGDVKVNEDAASVENSDAPIENGTSKIILLIFII